MTGSKVTAILMTKKCVYIINLFYKLMLDAFKGSETIDKKSLEYKEYVTQTKNVKNSVTRNIVWICHCLVFITNDFFCLA